MSYHKQRFALMDLFYTSDEHDDVIIVSLLVRSLIDEDEI